MIEEGVAPSTDDGSADDAAPESSPVDSVGEWRTLLHVVAQIGNNFATARAPRWVMTDAERDAMVEPGSILLARRFGSASDSVEMALWLGVAGYAVPRLMESIRDARSGASRDVDANPDERWTDKPRGSRARREHHARAPRATQRDDDALAPVPEFGSASVVDQVGDDADGWGADR